MSVLLRIYPGDAWAWLAARYRRPGPQRFDPLPP